MTETDGGGVRIYPSGSNRGKQKMGPGVMVVVVGLGAAYGVGQ